jgi:peptide/nickel transport system ATP-binding protein
MYDSLLRISGLSVSYGCVKVLEEVDLNVTAGEIVGVAGESGAGKTTLALAIPRLVEHLGGRTSGEIVFNGRDVMKLTEVELRELRGRGISVVFQDAVGALNPAARIGRQFEDVLRAHGRPSKVDVRRRREQLLRNVQLTAEDGFLRLYPSQLSGGMAQRVVLALALANSPKLLIADEPTSNLDVSTEAEILDLLRNLRRQLGIAILFISHNLAVMAGLCDRIVVLHRGRVVEARPTRQLFESPQHPYTRLLLSAIPRLPFAPPAGGP